MALPPPGSTDENIVKRPAKELLKRIDIGLATGVVAVLISFLALMSAWQQAKLSQQTAKAAVLPIIDAELGYTRRGDKPYLEMTLENVGAGIAHIQRVEAVQNGEVITDEQAFEDLIMNGRMRGWATLTEKPGAGYIRAGDIHTVNSYDIGGGANDIAPFLRGDYGTPFDGVDIKVCYCSVFDDCWETSWLRTAEPEPVNRCISGDEPIDSFADYMAQREEARRSK